MAMTAATWSLNGLATELGLDRRTIGRRLTLVKQAGAGPRGPLYLMRDAYKALTSWDSEFDSKEDTDAAALYFLAGFESAGGFKSLGARIATAITPDEGERVAREAFATALWRMIRLQDDPNPPDWSRLPADLFQRAWEALVVDMAPLSEVAAVARGEEVDLEDADLRWRGERRGLRMPDGEDEP